MSTLCLSSNQAKGDFSGAQFEERHYVGCPFGKILPATTNPVHYEALFYQGLLIV